LRAGNWAVRTISTGGTQPPFRRRTRNCEIDTRNAIFSIARRAPVNAVILGLDGSGPGGVFALDFPHGLPSLFAVHLVPMVLRWIVGCSFVLLLWLGFHANLPMSNSTWRGPVGENYSNSPAGSGRSPFQDNARHHLHNRHYRSHATNRAGTLQIKCGLSCRARL